MAATKSHPGPRPESLVNRRPLNQAAKRWLRQAGLGTDPEIPYVVQLLSEGFEANLSVPGQGQKYWADLELASGELLDRSLNPVQVMRWLTDNPNGPDQREQNDTLRTFLEQAKSWEEAAQSLMEWFYDRKAAQDPYYR
jgi:hypothetical protein